jgi:hypothetical protein
VCEAAAQDGGQRLLNISMSGFGILFQDGRRSQDDSRQTESALRGLFIDEGFLKRVRLLRRAESLKGRDLGAVD